MFTPCPICGNNSVKLHNLTFSRRLTLPESIALHVCDQCDFAFNTPRDANAYEAYYKLNVNDILGSDIKLQESEKARYQSQILLLQTQLDLPTPLRILDVGCGQAGLLKTIRIQYPDNTYYACDPNFSKLKNHVDGISYCKAWQALDGEFDLIILSHVVEHILDLGELEQLVGRLSPSGSIYIEVPNASNYNNFPRREYLYYFDRLHVNHFSIRALTQLLKKWGLTAKASGNNNFEYKDNKIYPAIYIVADKTLTHSQDQSNGLTLSQSLKTYIADEARRSALLGDSLLQKEEVVVYGFGDNFFKSIGKGGPLENVAICAVVDAKNEQLKNSSYADNYFFYSIDECCKKFPKACYVITISWSSWQIISALQERGVQDILEI